MKLILKTLGVVAVCLLTFLASAQADEKMVPLTTALSSTVISGYINTSIQWSPGTGNWNPPPAPLLRSPRSGHGVQYDAYLTRLGISFRILSVGEASPKDLRALYYRALQQGWVLTILPRSY